MHTPTHRTHHTQIHLQFAAALVRAQIDCHVDASEIWRTIFIQCSATPPSLPLATQQFFFVFPCFIFALFLHAAHANAVSVKICIQTAAVTVPSPSHSGLLSRPLLPAGLLAVSRCGAIQVQICWHAALEYQVLCAWNAIVVNCPGPGRGKSHAYRCYQWARMCQCVCVCECVTGTATRWIDQIDASVATTFTSISFPRLPPTATLIVCEHLKYILTIASL